MENKNLIKAFILFEDTTCDFELILKNLRNDWNIEVKNEIKDDKISFNIGNTIIALSFIKGILPNGEVENCAKNNLFWENGVEKASKYKAYMEFVLTDGKDPVKNSKLFVKIASSILKIKNTIGIYKYPTVIPSDMYIEVAEELKDDEFPVLDVIYIGLYRTDNGICGYTEGLEYFGKKEVEIIDTDVEVFELYEFLVDVANYVIVHDIKLNDGETIGFSTTQKIPMIISEGIAVKGESIKINFNNSNKNS